jgi:hypothetical protein
MSASPLNWRRLALACVVLILAGCSSTTFVYNRLDFLLPWYLGDYVDLDREQARYLDELLEPFLRWHRQHELPQYVIFLDQVQTTLAAPVDVTDLGRIATEARSAWLRTESRGLAWMLALGESLTDKQVDDLIQALWKQHETYRDKYLSRSDAQYYEDSYENLRDTVIEYVGRISKPQRRALEADSAQLRRSDAAWLAEQAQWFTTLEELLRREEGWQDRTREAVAARPDNAPALYRELLEHNTGVLQTALARLHASLTPRQKTHLAKRLAQLRDDLRKLSAQSTESPE